jgi:signal transduction histidine kinase
MDLLLRSPPQTRLRPRHWVAIDYFVAALLTFVYGVGFNVVAFTYGVPRWAAVVLAALAVLPAAVRRRWPRAVLALVTVSGAVQVALGTSSPAPPIAVAFVMYLIPLRFPLREAGRLLAATLLVTAAGATAFGLVQHGPYRPGGMTSAATLFGEGGAAIIVAWVIGYAARQQRAYVAARQEQAERQVREELAEVRQATSEERLQIARELHDVVAHSLSLIAVRAGVANYVIAEHPEEAARALTSIEHTSRGALAEMRALLEVLRAEPDGTGPGTGLPVGPQHAGLVPAPGLASLESLTARTAEAGVRVDLDIRGERPQLTPGLDLAAYRVIQEALTNVIKHAATDSCKVTVACQPDVLTVEITDSGPLRNGSGNAAAGHGLAGMRERVSMYGGQFQAGPRPGGGFRVAARFPLTGSAP